MKDAIPTPPEISFPDLHASSFTESKPALVYFAQKTDKRGMASMAVCECGAKEQTAEHVITSCLIYHHLNEACALLDVYKHLAILAVETCPAI